MLENVLKWSFKQEDKELILVMHPDTPLTTVQNFAYEILKYCAKIESDYAKVLREEEENFNMKNQESSQEELHE